MELPVTLPIRRTLGYPKVNCEMARFGGRLAGEAAYPTAKTQPVAKRGGAGTLRSMVSVDLASPIHFNKCVGNDIVANGNSQRGSIDRCGSKVYASEHTRVLHLFQSG
jgi:hypothetical protein